MRKTEKKSREKEFPDSEELCCWGLIRQWAGMGTNPGARAGGHGQGEREETSAGQRDGEKESEMNRQVSCGWEG